MIQTFYFHVCCQQKRFFGSGRTCYDAACKAVGSKRADAIARNTAMTKYKSDGEIVSDFESGVANFISRNGFYVASVTRVVSGV